MLWPERVRGAIVRRLAASLSVVFVLVSFRSAGQIYDGFLYTYDLSGGVEIMHNQGPGGAVVIPAQIPGAGTVTSLYTGAFNGCTNVTSVIIPNGVLSIGVGAFQGCTGLTNVTLADSVTSIGNEAFQGCTSLANVGIPSGVTSLGTGLFFACTSLVAITADPQNPAFSSFNGVLFDKSQSTLVVYPAGLAGGYAIPSSVTTIGVDAFATCGSLTSVVIPSGVLSIGAAAFQRCTGLASVVIPSSVTNIGPAPFGACSSLAAIMVDPQNPAYRSLNGVLFDKSLSLLVQYPAGLAAAYAIPSSVTSIGISAFGSCGGLSHVAIPNSVTNIGGSAFAACTSLPDVVIPANVSTLGVSAFAGCASLASVTFAGSPRIGNSAFSPCSALTGAFFQGAAPPILWYFVFDNTAPGFSIYYPATATGWTTPTWHGYPCQPYNIPPPGAPLILSLVQGPGIVTPSLKNLHPGTHYQLQVSTNLSAWTNTGPAFTATNSDEFYSEFFNTTNRNPLFFRLQSPPSATAADAQPRLANGGATRWRCLIRFT